MGMRAVLTRLLGIATVACALVATPAVASAETQVMPDGVKAEVLPLTQANNEPVQITEPGSYVLKTAEGEVTPSSGYTIDAPDASRINPVRIYIDGTVCVNDKTNWRVEQTRWLFNIKQGSNIEFIGVNNPCVSFHRNQKQFESVSGFLTDRYYSGGYKKASGDISVGLGVGDGSQNFILSYGSKYEQKVPAISLGNTKGKLSANFSKLMIRDYAGKSHNSLGEVSPYSILEYAVPVRLFRSSFSDDGKGNINKLNATFTDCAFWNTSGDYNGAVSIVGNPRGGVNSDVASRLTATFENCRFGSDADSGIWQTNNKYPTVEETTEFAQVQETGKCAVAGVMGVTNATVNLNNCTMGNFHSTRSSSADNTLTVDALNVARSARCNINGGTIERYGARGNTCVVYASGTLTLNGSPEIASYWKNSHAGDTNYGDKYTEADKATGTAKSLYVPKKKSVDANVPALNIASDFSVRGGFGDNVWVSIEETADSNGVKSRVLGTCESSEIEGVVPDGSSENDDNSDKYEIVNLNGDLTFRETIHQHKWKVEADGLGVRASCVDPFRNGECEYGMGEDGKPKKYLRATYKLSMSKATSSQSAELVYDGCPVKIALNKDGAWNLEQMGVTASDEFTWYQCKSQADAEAYKNGTKLKDAPADAGYYYVVTSFKTASGQTLEGKKAFEISPRRLARNRNYKFTLKDGGKGAGKYAYDGKEHQPVVESAKFKNGADEWVDLVEGKDYELSARSESGLKQTEPGQYECIVIGKGNFTTDGGTTSVLTLKWEIVDVSRFDLEVAGFDGTYDGDEHGITVNVKNDHVPADMKIEYREDGGDWTTDKPTYRNAAEYTTNYRVTASDYLTVTGKATVKITKADQEAPAGLVGNNWTTCNSKDGSISGVTKKMEYRRGSSGSYQKITSDGKLTGLAKSGTYYVRYAEDGNHNASADAEVKIEPGPHAVADNAAWKPNGEGGHVKVCKYCKKTQERQPCRWKYEIVTPATPEADGVRQRVCRVCNGKWDEEPYTYVDTYKPVIYDLWVDKAYCEGVSFDVFDDRDETVTVTDNGKELKAGKDGKYTVKAAEGDAGTEHVIVATDAAGNKETITIKMYAEHAYEWTTDKQPTVTEAGAKHGTCSVCGHESGAVEVPALAVKGYSGKYDGKEHSVDASALPEGAVVEYKAADSGWTSVAPSIKDAGSVTVDYRVTIDGAAVDGKVTLEVKPRAITVAAQDASKTYGEDDPKFTYDVTSGELVEGESLQGIEIEREDCDAVRDGGYALHLTQPEGANSNYKITFKDGTFTISKRELAVTWDTTTEFTYDGEKHCPQAKLHNVIEGDDVSAYVDGAKVKAGTYTAKITELTGDDAGNYKFPAEGLTCEFSIKKAPQGAPKVQATAETVSGKSDGKITGVDAKMEWRAKDSGEYQGVPEGVTEIADCAVGTYEVRYRADNDHDASSATEVTVNAGGKFVVTLPAKQVGYTITANPDELDWHGSTTLTVSIESGYFTDNDSYAVKVNNAVVTPDARGEFTVQNAESDLVVTVEGVRKHEAVNDEWLSDDSTHWHKCACGDKIDEAKHDFEWVIVKAPTATEKGSKQQKCKVCGHKLAEVEIPAAAIVGYSDEYDGDYHTVDATSLPKGATAKYSTDGKNWSPEAPKIKDVGTLAVAYQVTIDGATAEGEVTLEVKPRAITVAADDSSKTYGEADPVFTWAITSGELVEGESLQGIEIECEDNDNVRDGGYVLHLTQDKDANPNYNIKLVDGVFTINQRLLTVTWGTSEFVYDGEEHCPEATLGNVIDKDDLGVTVEGSQVEAGDSYQANLTALTGKAAGNYALPTEGLTCDFSIKNAAQGAPVVQAAAETVSGKRDGKITGVDATMEWRAKGAAEYQAVSEGTAELTGLAAGMYEVRYQAKTNYDASSATEVTVAAGPKLVVTLPSNQVGYALSSTATELDWHGTATLTMSIDSAYFAGKDYAVKVNGTSVKLSAKGTYKLKDVEGDVNVTVEGVLKHEPDGSGWAHDAKNHWHVCRCGEVIDKAEHTFEWVVDKPATVEAKGEKHQECKVCGEKGKSEEIAILAPEIIDGKGQTMVVDAAKDLSFRSNAPLEFFQKVLVDDKEVAAENYVLTEGSTIVTLKASFLNALGGGEHKLSVVSTTGTAETNFTVAEAAKPAPGQTTTTTTTTTSKSKKKAGKETLPESGDSMYAMAGAVLAAGAAALLLAWAMKRRA